MCQGVSDTVGKIIFRQSLVPIQYVGQVFIPAVIFPLEKSQEDLFLRLKIVIDRGAGKGCDTSDLLKSDFAETHRLIELLTGIDDFFSFQGNLFQTVYQRAGEN